MLLTLKLETSKLADSNLKLYPCIYECDRIKARVREDRV